MKKIKLKSTQFRNIQLTRSTLLVEALAAAVFYTPTCWFLGFKKYKLPGINYMLMGFMAVLVMANTAVQAQPLATEDIEATNNSSLEVITVKGNKERKSLFQNPESIKVLQENELPATGSQNSLQVLSSIPNVEVNKNGESFSIRGINNTGVTGYQKDNLSSVTVDGMFQTDLAIEAGSFHLWDMDRVEVMRGTQSTSQGINSLAGAILLDHKEASDQNEGVLKLGLGNFGHYETGVVINRLLNENLFFRLSYDNEFHEGYIKNIKTNNKKWGGWDKHRAAMQLKYKLDEESTLGIKAKFHSSDKGGSYVQSDDPFNYEVMEDVDYKAKTQNYQLITDYETVLSDKLTNKVILGGSFSKQKLTNDADGLEDNYAGARIENHKDHFISLENQLHYKNEQISNLFGIHLHHFSLVDDYDFSMMFTAPPAPLLVPLYQRTEREQAAYALFNSLTYNLNEQQAFIAGLRAEMVESMYSSEVQAPTQPAYSGLYDGRNSGIVALPKPGYVYTFDRHNTALTYAKGYRSSGVGINRSKTTAHEYGAEFTHNYELSYKYDGEQFKTTVNTYYIHWKEQQVQIQLSATPFDTQVVNAAESFLYGGEVETQYRYLPTQSVSVGLGYTDTKFKDFKTPTADYQDHKFPYAANWTARATHAWTLTDDFSVQSILKFVGKSYTNAENTKEAEEQLYLNLNAKYILSSWILEGYVNNVFDGQYQIYDGRPTGSIYLGKFHQVSHPREFGLRANYYW